MMVKYFGGHVLNISWLVHFVHKGTSHELVYFLKSILTGTKKTYKDLNNIFKLNNVNIFHVCFKNKCIYLLLLALVSLLESSLITANIYIYIFS